MSVSVLIVYPDVLSRVWRTCAGWCPAPAIFCAVRALQSPQSARNCSVQGGQTNTLANPCCSCRSAQHAAGLVLGGLVDLLQARLGAVVRLVRGRVDIVYFPTLLVNQFSHIPAAHITTTREVNSAKSLQDREYS